MFKSMALFLAVCFCTAALAGCSFKKQMIYACGDFVRSWAEGYDINAPDSLTVYVDNGGIRKQPQSITDPKTVNEVFSALSSIKLTGIPQKGPIDFTVSPVSVTYSFLADDGRAAIFTFLDGKFAAGDPVNSDGLLYNCSGTGRLFSIEGVDLSDHENAAPQIDANIPEPSEAQPAEPQTEPYATDADAQAGLKLIEYDGGYFSLMLPKGWQLHTMGQYSTFAFRAWDASDPDYEIFYYGNINPFLKSSAAQRWNEDMSRITPENSTYHLFADAPVADENDVSTVFYNLYAYGELVEKYTGIYFDEGISIPELRSFSVIKQMPIRTALAGACSSEALIFASLQAQSGTNCYGKFSASLFSAPPVMYDGIDMSIIAALGVTGVIAPQGDFERVEQTLSQAVFSLTFTQEYVDKAIEAGEDEFNQAMLNNETTQAVYDAYNAAWDAYNRK